MKEIPKRYINLYNRAMKGKSRKAAIQYFCASCVGFDYNEVKNCTDQSCSLYPYRIVQNKSISCA